MRALAPYPVSLIVPAPRMALLALATFSCMLLLLPAGKAQAQAVTLESKDSTISITGELIDFTGEAYILKTDLGDIEIDARNISCIGAKCPAAVDHVSRFAIRARPHLIDSIFRPLVQSYASTLGATLSTSKDALGQEIIRVSTQEGTLFGEILINPSTDPEATITLAFDRDATGRRDDPIVLSQIGYDALRIHTSPLNPLNAMSIETLSGILRGEITNWAEIGGPNAQINLYLPDEDTLDHAMLRAYFEPDLQEGEVFAGRSTVDPLSWVSADPFGMSLMMRQSQDVTNTLEIGAKSCMAQVASTPHALASGDYPMGVSLEFWSSVQQLPILAHELANYALTYSGQTTIASAGIIPLDVAPLGLNAHGNRLASTLLSLKNLQDRVAVQRAVETIGNGMRHDITMRFDPGTTDLNAAGQIAFERLYQRITRGDFADQKLILVGYEDDGGGRRLAEMIERQLNDRLGAEGMHMLDSITATQFGVTVPVVCAEVPAAAHINRRVEIWSRTAEVY